MCSRDIRPKKGHMITDFLTGLLVIFGILLFIIICLHSIQFIEDEFDEIL